MWHHLMEVEEGEVCCTAKTLNRKCESNISQKWNCTAPFPIPTSVNLLAIYIFTKAVCLFVLQQYRWTHLWEYINRSQIHECGIWERSRSVSFLGIYKSDLLRSAGWDCHCVIVYSIWDLGFSPFSLPCLWKNHINSGRLCSMYTTQQVTPCKMGRKNTILIDYCTFRCCFSKC